LPKLFGNLILPVLPEKMVALNQGQVLYCT